MWLQLGGVAFSGNSLFDAGLSDSAIVSTAQGNFAVMTSGPYGGLSVYQITGGGSLVPRASLIFPPGVEMAVGHRISLGTHAGETLVFFGATSTRLVGVVLHNDGTLGPVRQILFSGLEAGHLAGTSDALVPLAELTDTPTSLLPADGWQHGTVAVRETQIGGISHVLALGNADNTLHSYVLQPTGQASLAAMLGAREGLGIPAPTALETVTLNGRHFALVASSGASTISVIEIGANGLLAPVQQVIDTASTRFANVQDMAIARMEDHVFALAVGADHGVTLFRLLPDGQLVFLEAWANGAGGALQTPTTISASVSGTTLHAVIGAQNAPGVTHFTIDLSAMGQVSMAHPAQAVTLTGGAGHDVLIARSDNDTLSGGAGHDVLVSGPGRTVMTGGAGSDIFVIRPTSTDVLITDFRAGLDRLDLTALPMLRSTAQLSVAANSTGAVVTYRDTTITVKSYNGATLGLSNLFPAGLQGPDSIKMALANLGSVSGYVPPVLPPLPVLPPAPTQAQVSGQFIEMEVVGTLIGSAGDDFLRGSVGADVIRGGRGNDTIHGGFGHDTIFGGAGDDLIYGGPGNDRLWGEDGNDTIFGGSGNNRMGGGPGDDLMVGGPGNDTIYGGLGNDTLFGGPSGKNRLWGMDGDDLIIGGPGDDRIGGGRGNDTIYGNDGNNTIYGGMGDDLIYGGAGDDIIFGMDDNDTIFGGAGNDFIHGGAGDDVLDGGPGDDTLVGGEGADTFVFDRGHELALILDFTLADNDRLELRPALWDDQDFSAEQVVAAFAQVSGGQTVFDFGRGDVLTLAGFTDTEILVSHIDIL